MMIEESAKAVTEIAKTAGQAINASEKGARYITETFKDAIKELAGAAHDSARGFKIRNRASVYVKTESHLEKLGLDRSFLTIEERAAVPLIEALSNENDDGLQDLWAAYIANAANSANPIGITGIITHVISKLEPEDKIVLDYLFEFDLPKPTHSAIKLKADNFRISDEALNYTLSRLSALGLFTVDNSGSVGFAAVETHLAPCQVAIFTQIGWFNATPLLLMFQQSVGRA